MLENEWKLIDWNEKQNILKHWIESKSKLEGWDC